MLAFLALVGSSFVVIFTLFCICCGLRTINGFVEERPKVSQPILVVLNGCIGILHLASLLFVPSSVFPRGRVIFSTLNNGLFLYIAYLFPSIRIDSYIFITGLILTVLNHFLWFDLFVKNQFSILQIIAVYSIMVWLAPTSVLLCIRNGDFLLPFIHSYAKIDKQNLEKNPTDAEQLELKVMSSKSAVGNVASRIVDVSSSAIVY